MLCSLEEFTDLPDVN